MVKKRANGEGNIRKRADGRWEGRYTAGYHPETGKRIIKNVLGKTQAECKAKLKKAIEESQSLDIGRADEYTVAAWLRMWFELYAKPHIRPSTMNYYHRNIEQHIIPAIGDIQYIFRGKVAVCYKISLKYFSRLRNPASIERVIRLLCVPSALAISALLMPRKKCA